MSVVVFTDLDGTLLDHETYDHGPARPALDRLKRHGIPLVLASSKTAAEIAPLHVQLQLGEAPAIVENGAGLWRPGDAGAGRDAYDRLRAALDTLPEALRIHFRGFGDMGPDQIAQVTGLPTEAAAQAADRAQSEPGLWTGSDQARATFIDALTEHGITARQGGRFLTLSFGGTKADRMAEIARAHGATTTIALGDAPNDTEMLERADHGVIVANPHGAGLPELAGERAGRIRRTALPGPAGWNATMNEILDELDYGDDSHG
ncbi:HAD-IIB family hydrolase [Pseudoponticoccus marisrubri]|uniref:Mannosyl-3-phosphoglycerate phosphatase n=1 Tax=Pseudoponticoccus marisrubri TaxID=1685382 RepID=A0A0W7WFY6_9RHOB|nr:HAD-IIB family hydrolase [Pseudoponticoccus marisrubri]KUF09390.1 mannosyl-3-phosphoglycerate phosphatase [Pseudoponticoccus marisrubri]